MPKRTGQDDAEYALRNQILEMYEIAARLYEDTLRGPAGADARAYIAKRGVTEALAGEFRLGFSERGGGVLAKVLRKQDYPDAALESSGLVKRREDGSFYDAFRGRLMFPIANESGKVIAFGGRAMFEGDEPKYLNSPGTPVYVKSNVLYSLHRAKDAARKHDRVVLVEGYMDVVGAWSAGIAEAVAPCGTALTQQQASVLRRFAPVAVVNFDPDAAGANATERSIQLLLDAGLRVRVATLDGGLDPDEFVKANGAAAYRERLAVAQPYFHWLAGRARQKFDTRTSEGKVQALESLLPRVRQIRDRVERAALANELAAVLGVDHGLLLEQFRRAAAGRGDQRIETPVTQLPPAEKVLLELVIANTAVRNRVMSQIGEYPALLDGDAGEIWRALTEVGDFTWDQLEKKLTPVGATLLASLAFADHSDTEQDLLEQAEACLQTLQLGNRRSAEADLKRQIREAEQRGSIMEALELAEELNRLKRKN